jgi:hypothetical protein
MPLNESGFELIQNFIDLDTATSVIEEVDSAFINNNGGGIRNAEKKFGIIYQLSSSEYILSQASKYLSGKPCLVRAILFDKSASNNWLVAWHQDKTIALSSSFELNGWGPWSIKDGVHHVQPPIDVLEDMITFRIHLDESTLKNGCLKLIEKSHSLGVLSQGAIYSHTKSTLAKIIVAPSLSALVMRPHVLHASSKATEPSRRRILHLEYSSYTLPNDVSFP